MGGLDLANDRLNKEEERTEKEEAILEAHTINSKNNYLKAAEDAIEANDNNFDGLINAVPDDGEDDPDDDYSSEVSVKRAREYEETRQRTFEEEAAKREKISHARAHAHDHLEIER